MSIRILNALTLFFVIVGGVNWGIVGIFEFDVIKAIFGEGNHATDPPSAVARIMYVIVGLSALWQLGVLFRRLTPKD